MFSASLAARARTTAIAPRLQAQPAIRRVARVRIGHRFQSTSSALSSTASSGSAATHAAAGVAGGAAVLLGAYAYYHFSGVKKAVDASKSVQQYYEQTKANIAAKAPKNPNEVIQFLRSVVKSYAGVVPGASGYVDSTFDTLDELHETHGEELDKILQGAYDEVSAVLKDAQSKGTNGVDVATAGKLMDILVKRTKELTELGAKAGSDVFSKLEEKYPMVAQTLGSSYGELKALAKRGGPEARKLVDETVSQVQELLSNSKSVPDGWNRAKELVQAKAQKVKELVWERATEEAKENPELQKLLQENKDTFVKAGSSLQSLREVLERVAQAVKDGAAGNKEKMGELREFVQSKAQEAQSKGWGNLQEWAKSVPGGNEALKKLSDVDMQALMALSQKKSGDAKQLAEETYRDVLKVLQEKAAKAKKTAEESKDEAKENSSKSR